MGFMSICQPLQRRPLEAIVTYKHKIAVDTAVGDELDQQRCGELNCCAVRAFDDDLLDRTSEVFLAATNRVVLNS